ncbi:MAG: sigma-70 family RNA polymerase sigma factor [Planctomycetota bacterium]
MSGDDVTPEEVGDLLEGYRERLRRMVELRIDPRIRGRIDTSDVIQDAYVEVMDRLPHYRKSPDMPFYLWVRFITGQKLAQLHRRHLGALQRDARRDVDLEIGGAPAASSSVIASALAATGLTSPSGAAMRGEEVARLEKGLESLRPTDREILVLRHFEQLGNSDVARVLGLSEAAASARYWRAARRLREVLEHR